MVQQLSVFGYCCEQTCRSYGEMLSEKCVKGMRLTGEFSLADSLEKVVYV